VRDNFRSVGFNTGSAASNEVTRDLSFEAASLPSDSLESQVLRRATEPNTLKGVDVLGRPQTSILSDVDVTDDQAVVAQVRSLVPTETLESEVGLDFNIPSIEGASQAQLARGINAFQLAQDRLRGFGFEIRDDLSQEGMAEAGMILYDMVRDWEDLKPSARIESMALFQTRFNSLVGA